MKIKKPKRTIQRKESRKLVDNYDVDNYDVIVFEDMRVKNILKNHKLAKSIAEASWPRFIQYVVYKAESAAGKKVVLVNSRTSKIFFELCTDCLIPGPKGWGLQRLPVAYRLHHKEDKEGLT